MFVPTMLACALLIWSVAPSLGFRVQISNHDVEEELSASTARPFEPTSLQMICQQLREETQAESMCDTAPLIATTADGVKLPLHRIPRPNAPAVLLQHGLMGSSADWLQLGADSMPFVLWRAGFDVWLGNNRGNDYSEQLHPLSSEQWSFSFEDLGRYDFPALVEGVLQHSGQSRLVYVGYSLGTLQAFLGLSEQTPAWQTKIRLYVALAPISFMGSMRGGRFDHSILAKMLHNAAGDRKNPFRGQIKSMCKLSCKTCANQVYGGGNFVSSNCKGFFDYNPAGTSVKNLRHMSQYVVSGYPHRYDLGKKGNLERYGASVPPPFCLERISVPTAMIYGTKDWLADPYGVARLEQVLPKQYRFGNVSVGGDFKYKVDTRGHKFISMDARAFPVVDFGHADFIWSQEAVTRIYNVVKELIQTSDAEISTQLYTPPARSEQRFVYLAFCSAMDHSKCPMKIDRVLKKISRTGCSLLDSSVGTPCPICGFDENWVPCQSDPGVEGGQNGTGQSSTKCHDCFCETWCGKYGGWKSWSLSSTCTERCAKWVKEYDQIADGDPSTLRCAGP